MSEPKSIQSRGVRHCGKHSGERFLDCAACAAIPEEGEWVTLEEGNDWGAIFRESRQWPGAIECLRCHTNMDPSNRVPHTERHQVADDRARAKQAVFDAAMSIPKGTLGRLLDSPELAVRVFAEAEIFRRLTEVT